MPKFPFKSALSLLSAALLSACSLVKYQPLAGIDTVDLQRGYRFETSQLQRNNEDDTLIVLMFSGGGTRAADKNWSECSILFPSTRKEGDL